MAKEEVEEIIEYEDYEADYIEGLEELSDDDKVEQDSNGQVKFKSVNHSKRAEANEVETDGEIATYANYALDYFNYRCALSGEKFVIFDEPIQRGKNNKLITNLSAEHILALTTGGNDIIPNIIPSVYQYNIQKNGYYILDWWPKAKDVNGNPIYNPEKLLKIVNYMLKSLQIRKDLGIKKQPREYRKRLLTPNGIDEFLMQEEIAEGLLSDTITATTEVEDGKNILTQIPQQEGAIPSLAKQKDKETKITEAMFLTDALEVLGKEEKIPQEIIEKLQYMYKEVEGEIPFEIEVRKHIISILEQMGIENNKYTVANDVLINTDILELVKKNPNELDNTINEFIKNRVSELDVDVTNEQKIILITMNPSLLYDKHAIEYARVNIERYKRYIGQDVDFELLSKTNIINILAIKEWMEVENTKIPPRPPKPNVPEEEGKLGNVLGRIRHRYIKKYESLNVEEKEQYKKENPEIEIVIRIIDDIDRNNIKRKEDSVYYSNALKIKEWMEKNKTTKPPRERADNVPEEEGALGEKLRNIKDYLLKPYYKFETETKREEYRKRHPELEDVIQIVEEILRNNVKYKEDSSYYWNALKIKKWMEKNKTTKPPRQDGDDRSIEEKTLGNALGTIRTYLIRPYMELETENQRDEYRKKHPELEAVMAIIEEIDKNNIPQNLRNALKIKAWMITNQTLMPPRKQNRNKTVSEEEAKLGAAYRDMKRNLIKPYLILECEEEREEYRRKHPELEEVMAIVEEIDKNNPKSKKKIKDTLKQNKNNLSEAMQSGEELEAEILMAEKVEERSASDGRRQ